MDFDNLKVEIEINILHLSSLSFGTELRITHLDCMDIVFSFLCFNMHQGSTYKVEYNIVSIKSLMMYKKIALKTGVPQLLTA